MASNIEGKGGESVGRRLVLGGSQIFHQHVKDFRTTFGLVYSTQHGRHIRLFDGLKGFDHSREVHFLWFSSAESPNSATLGIRTYAPLIHR